jgi:hypothetical protein
MHYVLLLLLLLGLPTLGKAQCGCGELRLAMNDKRHYQYRYYILGKEDTITVELLNRSNQIHRGRGTTAFVHENAPDRPHMQLHLPAYQTTQIEVEVMEVRTQQKMWLTFTSHGLDHIYRLILDFAPGHHYQLTLGAPSQESYPGFDITTTAPHKDGPYWLKLHKQ